MLNFDKDSQLRIFSTAEARSRGEPPEDWNLPIARLMDQHPEFEALWLQGESAMIPQVVAGGRVNPFVHLVLHGIIDAQIRDENPEFVTLAYNRLKAGGMGEHEALHAIMAVYGDLHFRGVRGGGQFDFLEYEVRLES
jgi:hypothetical protein